MATTTKAPAKKAAAAKKASTKTTTPKDAIALLVADHREVKSLFEKYQELVDSEAEDGEKKSCADMICGLLTVHATIEEEIFYAAAYGAFSEDDEDMLDEAEVEHASAKELIAQIQGMEPTDDLYDAKVKVLGEYIDHHVKEEEGEMFPACKKTDMDLVALGEALLERKEELMEEMDSTA